jgi:hypothetical protein
VSLGLFYRHNLGSSEQIEFDTSGQIPASLIGYISGRDNPEPSAVSNWLRKHRMPSERLYIPMFIYAGTRSDTLRDENTGGWGQGFDINPESVLPDLEIVCRWDIQNTALNRKPANWFTDLRKLSVEEKIAALLAESRKSPSYAEVRMFRPLRIEDFLIRHDNGQ